MAILSALKRVVAGIEWQLPHKQIDCASSLRASIHSLTPHRPWGDRSLLMATAQLTPVGVGIHNVLIATDFSHHSDIALRFGLSLAHLYGAQAEIVYVLPTDEYVLSGPEGLHAAHEAARRDLLDFKSRLHNPGSAGEHADCHVSMLEGPVAECLLQCAYERQVNLIVLGTHGRGGIGKVFLGSVAEKVFRHSPIPVLTVGPNIRHRRDINRTHHILAPCDLTPRSHPAVEYACDLAEEHNSELTVLHVVDRLAEVTKLDPEKVRTEIQERLANLLGRHTAHVGARYRVEFGNVPSAILRVAAEISSDFIVLGVRRSSGALDRLMWPIAYELVRAATCPVLTIRVAAPPR
jgi:nucleotide-binding universal stress UspA family protein